MRIHLLTLSIALLYNPLAVLANCSDTVRSLEESQPQVQAKWQELQKMSFYPWGRQSVYQKLEGDRITLNANFDQLRDGQKAIALKLLKLEGMPHQVLSSDGRLLSAAYDGCTRFYLLTERERYSWYLNSIGRTLPKDLPPKFLRNFNRPSWRKANIAIDEQTEAEIRLLFWQKMGYQLAQNGLWIAWVPEQGYFEINVPNRYDVRQLQKFWDVVPYKYRFTVLSSDGTLMMDIDFAKKF
ncbi:MAG: hypothetical protein NW214_05160 [Pseudanabaenaceae cyanobacterium bins.39]|nr:hypothetical protein [Pseudanabaenaceae cyanobacterium bins.39]